TPAPADPSRTRRTRSTRRRRARCARRCERSATWRRPSPAPTGPRESCFAMARSTVLARHYLGAGDSSRWAENAGSRRCAAAPGVWRFVRIADAAEATVAAIERGRRVTYNIVDDEPAPVADWLPALAQKLGAPKPWRVPRLAGRLFAGEAGAVMMTDVRGASN